VKRRLFNILSAVSLLLCAATMVLGILGIWVTVNWTDYGEGAGPYVVV